VNAYTTQSTRTITWQASLGAVCTAGFSLSTDDLISSVTTLPMPTLKLVFGGRSSGDLTLTRAGPAARSSARSSAALGDPPGRLDATDEEARAHEHPHRIELSIDSLPNYLLIEPIPVAIDPLGDAAYTAWVRNLDTNATGHSVIEALLLLKERIEFVYGDLSNRSHLTPDEKTTLQMLHTYIAPKKPEWL
jgi:hypothetical protein